MLHSCISTCVWMVLQRQYKRLRRIKLQNGANGEQEMLTLASAYTKSVQEEATLTPEQLKTRHVGKLDPKRHLAEAAERAMGQQVSQNLAMGVLAEL